MSAHPRLLLTPHEIDELTALAQTNLDYKRMVQNEILSPAQRVAATLTLHGVTLPDKGASDAHVALALQARTAGLGFAFTGNQAMAQAAQQILMAYATNYKHYPLHSPYDGRVTIQTINESPWLIDLAWTYDLIWHSGVLSDDDRHMIEEDLLWEGVRVIDRYDKGLSNWQAWHNAAIGAVAFLLSDTNRINEVLYGPQGFMYHVHHGIRSDGLWWEQSIIYHDHTRYALILLAEMAIRHGYNLYVDHGEPTLKSMFDGPIHGAFSDGMHPIIGNAHYHFGLEFDWTYAVAALRYGNPLYAALRRATTDAKPQLPLLFTMPALQALPHEALATGTGNFAASGMNLAGSSLFADTGMAVLRSPHGTQSLEAALIWKPHGTTTGHQGPDNLTLIVEGPGGRWLPGPGCFDYSRSEQGTWYKHTIARNGVVVDETSQYPQGITTRIFATDDNEHPSSGELLHFVALPTASVVTARTDRVYSGVTMERTLLLSAPYLIDVYRVASDQVHQYDWVAHLDASEACISLDQTLQEGPLGPQCGYQHITAIRSAHTHDTWQAVWDKDPYRLQLMMLGHEATQVIRASGLGPRLTRQPMVVARREAKATQFVAVMEAYRGKPSVIGLEALSVAPGVSAVELKRSTALDHIVVDRLLWRDEASDIPAKPVRLPSGELYQGDLVFLRAGDDGQTESTLLLNGTCLETAHFAITSHRPTDMAIENTPDGFIVMAQNSVSTRILTLQFDQRDTAMRLFSLASKNNSPKVECHELPLTKTADVASFTWEAQPGVIYILGADPPAAEWLERFVVPITPKK